MGNHRNSNRQAALNPYLPRRRGSASSRQESHLKEGRHGLFQDEATLRALEGPKWAADLRSLNQLTVEERQQLKRRWMRTLLDEGNFRGYREFLEVFDAREKGLQAAEKDTQTHAAFAEMLRREKKPSSPTRHASDPGSPGLPQAPRIATMALSPFEVDFPRHSWSPPSPEHVHQPDRLPYGVLHDNPDSLLELRAPKIERVPTSRKKGWVKKGTRPAEQQHSGIEARLHGFEPHAHGYQV
ncbi:hypothetical protein JCM10213_002190 [Rhodosporidiobolus nylandii]